MLTKATDERYKGIWTGKRGLIIGRGAGSDYEQQNIDNFKGKVIGCNTAFKSAKCDAIVLMDEIVFYRNKEEYRRLTKEGMLLFIVNPIYPLYGVDVISIEARKPERCTDSFDTGFYPCRLSGYVALNIALLLGLNPIYLLGFNPGKAREKEKDKVIERSLDFLHIADYCDENSKKVYITDKENNLLSAFFNYKPLTRKKRRRK